MFGKNSEVRFLKYTKKEGDCLLWVGGKSGFRYGQFYHDHKYYKAHRFSYLMYNGEIPEKMLVCHSCDNPLCVNPAHLFLGTQDDNMKDMKSKGRANRPVGSKNGRAKLTEEDVSWIRSTSCKLTNIELSKLYHVSVVCISDIRNYKSWVAAIC